MNRLLMNARFPISNLHRLNPIVFYWRKHCFSIMIDTRKLKVNHDDAKQEFFINLEKYVPKKKAILRYKRKGENVLNFYSTEVPFEVEKHAIATLLAEAAFEYAKTHNLKMELNTDVLQKYIKNNPRPEYSSRIIK